MDTNKFQTGDIVRDTRSCKGFSYTSEDQLVVDCTLDNGLITVVSVIGKNENIVHKVPTKKLVLVKSRLDLIREKAATFSGVNIEQYADMPDILVEFLADINTKQADELLKWFDNSETISWLLCMDVLFGNHREGLVDYGWNL